MIWNFIYRPDDGLINVLLQSIIPGLKETASVTRPVQELKGFKRVNLAPGETRTITFKLDVRQLGFYNQFMAYVVEPGAIEVMIGSSSQDIRARGSFTITGPTTDISRDKVFFSTTTVE